MGTGVEPEPRQPGRMPLTFPQASPTLLLRPEPSAWFRSLRWQQARTGTGEVRWPAGLDAAARLFRAQLGLPHALPLVMTGHAPEFWHPGVLAKFIAADVFAPRVGALPVWLMADQVPVAECLVRYPALRQGVLTVGTVRLREAGQSAPDSAGVPPDTAAAFVCQGLARMIAAWHRHAQAGSLPVQALAAVRDLAGELLDHPQVPVVWASTLGTTALFGELVRRMRDDPRACVQAYNHAARVHPAAGVRLLLADERRRRYELPLWRRVSPTVRVPVFSDDLARAGDAGTTAGPGATGLPLLLPRALLLTAMVRLAGCDLFIHGTGGGGDDAGHEGYDRVMEAWLESWLGLAPAVLAPVVVVSATLHLPLLHDVPTPTEAARAAWLAHRAAHDPGLLGDTDADRRRRELLARLQQAAAPARAALFARLHALLDEYRARHAETLAALRRHAQAARAQSRGWAVLTDRTWPFPLYPPEALRALRQRIVAGFASAS